MRPETRAEQVAREDLITFINACFASTGQREFYGSADDQRVPVAFLHDYVLGNHRTLYARTLAAGINDVNAARIVVNLLATARDATAAQRREEGQLIAAALRAMPPQRAYRALAQLAERRVNNRRTRAIVREFLASRDLTFDALKYRPRLRRALRHAHVAPAGEVGPFVFAGARVARYATPLLETWRRAHFDRRAVYDLPYTVADGLAERLGIERDAFVRGIQPRLTAQERLRLADTSAAAGADDAVDLHSAPLGRLTRYVLSRSIAERTERLAELDAALTAAAARIAARAPFPPIRIAAVLDSSFSTSGARETRRHPLATAVAASYLLRAVASSYSAHWTSPVARDLLAEPRGPTHLATPLLAALAGRPDLVVIVSDGCENDPPGATAELVRVFRRRFDPGRATELVHVNPVFDAEHFGPRPLAPAMVTLGLRDPEHLLTMLGFARFADGSAHLGELEAQLAARAAAFCGGAP
jgi:hypothetical protein